MSESMKKPKLLILVPSGMPQAEAEALRTESQARLEKELGSSIECELSSHWWSAQFERAGSWDSWIWETVTGKSFNTRGPHFDGFVVCTEQLGKANAGIVGLALKQKRSVLACRNGYGKLQGKVAFAPARLRSQ